LRPRTVEEVASLDLLVSLPDEVWLTFSFVQQEDILLRV
jgi:hypothetical protein